MTKITEIQQAIMDLPESEYVEFRQWFNDLDWKRWDRQIESDSKEGKLDFLISEAYKDR